MNPNVLHRWVREHERYGKHSLDDLDVDGSALVTRAPTNWIPLNSSPGTTDGKTVTPGPNKIVDAEQPSQASDTVEVELAARGLTMTGRWPVSEHAALAQWTRELLT